MNSIIPKRYIWLVGLGLMYMWGTALVAWLDLWQSSQIGLRIIAFLGAALVSLSGIAISFYTNDLELKVKRLNERNERNKAEAAEWKKQAQLAITLLRKERNRSALHP